MCDGGCGSEPIASSVTYLDQDPSPSTTTGTIHIGRATDESSLDAYRVYWADKTGKKLSVLANANKTGADLDVAVAKTTVPVTATSFVVVAVSKGKDATTGVTISPVDNYPRRTDLGMDSAQAPSVAFDPDGQKVLVAANAAAMSEVPFVYLCGPDGTGCSGSTLQAPPQSGKNPSALVDSGKLLLATTHGGNGNRATLLVCDADGTNCGLEQDLSAGQGTDSGLFPMIRTDGAGRILVATRNVTTPWLTRCSTAGTQCTGKNVSGNATGFDAADPRTRPFLVVGGGGLAVIWQTMTSVMGSHCAIDGTACGASDIGTMVPGARDPSAAWDETNQKVLVVVRNPSAGDKPFLIRCSPALAGCTATDISAGHGAGKLPSIAVDSQKQKLRVVTSENGQALLISCALDGTNCSAVEMSPSTHDVGPASLFVDEAGQRLYASWNEDAGAKTVLFQLQLF